MDWQSEVRDLHDFFARWISGDEPAEALGRLEAVLHPSFTIVGPEGAVADRPGIIAAVASAHGLRGTAIEVREFHELFASDRIVIGRYDEWQQHDDGAAGSGNGRRSTTVFVRWDDAPHGVAWLTVHETALPDGNS